MNMIIGKKQIVMASLVAALGLAVFVNWYYTGNENLLDTENLPANETSQQEILGAAEYVDNTAEQSADEYFAAAKLDRTTARDEAVETLQTVIDSCDPSSEAAVAAVLELSALNSSILLENEVESLITAKVNSNCICKIDEKAVEIVVEEEILNDESVLAISDIVYANCENVENIRITGA
ncbi:MAG: SpoIIIAH-like family protein [Clostridia bacterium]|nr:SpoIIIAH-like family protein [Clostridia bacterium]MBR3955320.1 SpoIIIAH-like family protein [Clostridia bacterium]